MVTLAIWAAAAIVSASGQETFSRFRVTSAPYPGTKTYQDPGSQIFTYSEPAHGKYGPIERWRLLLPEKLIHSWVDGAGVAWVLTRADFHETIRLWARDSTANLLGEWTLASNFLGTRELANLDLSKSFCNELGTSRSLRFDLEHKDGSLDRFLIVRGLHETEPVTRNCAAGTPRSDLLLEALQHNPQRPEVQWPFGSSVPAVIWHFGDSPGISLLDQLDRRSSDSNLHVVKESRLGSLPATAFPGPNAFYTMFVFDDRARLVLFDETGAQVAELNLLELTGLGTAADAKRLLRYRDLSVQTSDGRAMPIQGGERPQGSLLLLTDRTGKVYRIAISRDAQGSVTLTPER